jgi:hypothetical protein
MRAIIARLRKHDIQIHEVGGWTSRGAGGLWSPRGIIDHHDASSTASGKWGALGVVTNGRPGIPGPLSQFQVARGRTPAVAIVAAGRANHAGVGGPHKGIPANSGNAYLYGAEKANNGVNESYSDEAIYASSVLFAVTLEVIG